MFSFKKVTAANIESLVEFSELKLWEPHYPKLLVQRFLTELVSSSDSILDLHDANGRIAAAVLLDRVSNPAQLACLEILGLRNGIDQDLVLRKITEMALRLRTKNYQGFLINLPYKNTLALKTVASLGYRSHYDTFEMRNESLPSVRAAPSEIREAGLTDADQIYDVLCAAFAKSLDTNIVERAIWKKGFLSSPEAHFFVWTEGGEMLGFASLFEDVEEGETELRSIGVVPPARGRGIGRHLLYHCLAKTECMGFSKCRLTVTVTNEKAMDLYVRAGFVAFNKFRCLRKDFNTKI